jgi:hypothetical protein
MSGQPVVGPWDLAVSRASSDLLGEFEQHGVGAGVTILERTRSSKRSTVFPLGDWEAAFEAVRERTVIKTLLDPTTGAGR